MCIHPVHVLFLGCKGVAGSYQHRDAAVRLVWAWMAVKQQIKSCSKGVVLRSCSPACSGKELSAASDARGCERVSLWPGSLRGAGPGVLLPQPSRAIWRRCERPAGQLRREEGAAFACSHTCVLQLEFLCSCLLFKTKYL